MREFLKAIVSFVLVLVAGAVTWGLLCAPNRSEENAQRLRSIHESGGKAYLNGVPAEANPETATEYRRKWLEGWGEESAKHKGAPDDR